MGDHEFFISLIQKLYVERLAKFFVAQHDEKGFCSSSECEQRAFYREERHRIPSDEDWQDFLWAFLCQFLIPTLRREVSLGVFAAFILRMSVQ